MAFARWLIDKVGVATVPGSSSTLPPLLLAVVFPKKDEKLDAVEKRFEKLPASQ